MSIATPPERPSTRGRAEQVGRPRQRGFFGWSLAWLWRIAVGVALCFNFFVLNYLTSIAVFGWLQRWSQSRVLKGWWKRSRWREQGSFEDFCAQLGQNAPQPRPRWFWRERGTAAAALLTPIHSLLLNFKQGIQALFGVYTLTLVPCLLMLYSWDFGWLNSFHKGYEQWWVGIAAGWIGLFAFIIAMFYVPMALAHQAAAGEFRAFFQFRLIRRLILARLTAYLGLAFLYGFISIIFEAMRLFLLSEQFPGNDRSIDAVQGLHYLRLYFLAWTVPFFLSLLLLRGVGAAVYRSAVLKALRQDRIQRDDLPANIVHWLDVLEIMPAADPRRSRFARTVRGTARFTYRRVATLLMFLLWFGFIARFYVGYFLISTDALGFMNHPLVQLPCIDYTPIHLAMGRNE